MRFAVRHELPGRLRLALEPGRRPGAAQAAAWERALRDVPGVRDARLGVETGSLLVVHEGTPAARRAALAAVARLDSAPGGPAEAEPGDLRRGRDALARSLLLSAVGRALGGAPQAALAVCGAWPFLREGLRSLAALRPDAQLLDAAALGAAVAMGDHRTASAISSLLKVGDHLRLRTEARARQDLSRGLRPGERGAWVRRGGRETLVKAASLAAGDVVIVRAGAVIPVDGKVVEGRATVDQSSLTGESAPVLKRRGSPVYDGTVVADGRLDVLAAKVGPRTRRARIIRLVRESARHKAGAEARAHRLADRLSPYVLSAAGLTQALARDPRRAASVLLVDYSCALKLSVPIAIKTGLTEALRHGVLVRGGRFLEGLAAVDTVVFDKTGTLTEAKPRVVGIFPAAGWDRAALLKATACVEEHFPHPAASAIIREAARLGLAHEEEDHGEVKYVVSHGVVSTVGGRRFVVGSRRLLLQEGITLDGSAAGLGREGRSLVYAAVGGRYAGAFALEDPLRPEVPEVLAALRGLGVKRMVILTGDNEANARRIARLGFDEFHAEVSPEEKARVVRRLAAEGARVAVLGDGINDAPALAAAEVGISLEGGTDLARETADVLILRPDLRGLPLAIRLARLAMGRVESNFRWVVGINSALIGMAVLGGSTPAFSALAHNLATLGVSLRSLEPYLPGAGSSRAGRAGRAPGGARAGLDNRR